MSRAVLHCGNVIDVLRGLPESSVQCAVSSPPYWGLRDYGTPAQTWGGDPACEHDFAESTYHNRGGKGGQGETSVRFGRSNVGGQERLTVHAGTCGRCGAWRGHLGLEPTPDLYVEHMVAVFREVGRVLRDDGVLWLNLGDSYAADGKRTNNNGGGATGLKRDGREESSRLRSVAKTKTLGMALPAVTSGLKPKDLVGIPWRVALALQADGWWLRSDVVWSKPNPMPESVTDRPTRSHEYLFLLTKSERYFYDSEAIAEPAGYAHDAKWDPGTNGLGGDDRKTGKSTRRFKSGNLQRDIPSAEDGRGIPNDHRGRGIPWEGVTRNARSVWTIATQPYAGAHFATFPEELARRCILAGSSPKACEHCGAPWERVTEREGKGPTFNPLAIAESGALPDGPGTHRNMGGRYQKWLDENPKQTTGWQPTCACENTGVGRSVVLDPFGGSGTVAQVATGNARDAIHIDLNPAYLELARQRIGPMLCDEPEAVA